MLQQSIVIGKIFGIPLGVNYSWFIVFSLVTFSLGNQFSMQYPEWGTYIHYIIGLTTSILFFASVLLHELGHSVAAHYKGIKVRAITLFIFGGVAQIEREPDRPLTEFIIAIMGPVVSIMLAAFFFGTANIFKDISESAYVMSLWLARINTILVLFNMIPGFPLDGGRVLRAILWYFTESYIKSTKIASTVGQGFGYIFILGGVFLILTDSWFQGLWLAFIGWFLLNAAMQVSQYATLKSSLSGLRAKDVMQTDCPRLPGSTQISDLIDDYLLRTGRRCYLVTDGERLSGLVTLHQIKELAPDDRQRKSLTDIMTPFEELHHVEPDTEVSEILDIVTGHDIGQVPVVDSGKLIGLIGRDHLLKVIRMRSELGI